MEILMMSAAAVAFVLIGAAIFNVRPKQRNSLSRVNFDLYKNREEIKAGLAAKP